MKLLLNISKKIDSITKKIFEFTAKLYWTLRITNNSIGITMLNNI